jgi:hypothetical protein
MTVTPDDLGRAAYEGFHCVGFIHWNKLDPKTKAMWVRAAEAVRDKVSV